MEVSPFDAAGDAAGIDALDSLPMPPDGSKKERIMTEEEVAKKVRVPSHRGPSRHCHAP